MTPSWDPSSLFSPPPSPSFTLFFLFSLATPSLVFSPYHHLNAHSRRHPSLLPTFSLSLSTRLPTIHQSIHKSFHQSTFLSIHFICLYHISIYEFTYYSTYLTLSIHHSNTISIHPVIYIPFNLVLISGNSLHPITFEYT